MQKRAAVIEWAPFRTRSGVHERELLAASDALQGFLETQQGFVGRQLLAGKDGWVDLVYWTDDESAQAIMAAVAESETCHRYFALMDGMDHADPGAEVSHFRIARSYSG
jgi:hypothetical protein